MISHHSSPGNWVGKTELNQNDSYLSLQDSIYLSQTHSHPTSWRSPFVLNSIFKNLVVPCFCVEPSWHLNEALQTCHLQTPQLLLLCFFRRSPLTRFNGKLQATTNMKLDEANLIPQSSNKFTPRCSQVATKRWLFFRNCILIKYKKSFHQRHGGPVSSLLLNTWLKSTDLESG